MRRMRRSDSVTININWTTLAAAALLGGYLALFTGLLPVVRAPNGCTFIQASDPAKPNEAYNAVLTCRAGTPIAAIWPLAPFVSDDEKIAAAAENAAKQAEAKVRVEEAVKQADAKARAQIAQQQSAAPSAPVPKKP